MSKGLERSAVLSLSLLAMWLVISCGSTAIPGQSGGTTPPGEYLAVSDSGNNRVLIYKGPFVTGEAASVVLGQPDFTQSGPNQTTNWAGSLSAANTFESPGGIAADAQGNLYVADEENCRVLKFSPPLTTDMNASMVFGQSSIQGLKSQVCGIMDQVHPPSPAFASGLDGPVSVAMDASGDLWVCDSLGNRILEYVPPFSSGMAASLAIGQPTLDATSPCDGEPSGVYPPPTAATLCYPWGIAFDHQGDLWVADTQNSRVLEFVPPFSTGMAASLEIGQPAPAGFTSQDSCTAVSASCVVAPGSVSFDSAGNLWVADSYANRVLEFRPPFFSGMSASLVLGQPDFTSYNSQPVAASSLSFGFLSAGELAFDTNGDLLVADTVNDRVLVFTPPFRNGMNASAVLGQQNMTTGSPDPATYDCEPASASTLCNPGHLLVYVGDPSEHTPLTEDVQVQ